MDHRLAGRSGADLLGHGQNRQAYVRAMSQPKKFTNAKDCKCRPGPCPVHSSVLATICYHCHNPQEGMNFECDDCTKRRAALEKLARSVIEFRQAAIDYKFVKTPQDGWKHRVAMKETNDKMQKALEEFVVLDAPSAMWFGIIGPMSNAPGVMAPCHHPKNDPPNPIPTLRLRPPEAGSYLPRRGLPARVRVPGRLCGIRCHAKYGGTRQGHRGLEACH